ncbi:E3 ubiquitin-protein ligase TRIM11-like isoform X1 [Heteronotia binoei]|uniref:E3 ubiquitin-protein ligase TRIM11-like isoform X1 n=1 Tax=Heteronotia binoei TaxID=13085 RepID=UPI002930CD7F|nr:E3 ubiquitin-protein ligase TRIM11-like isoform X1 [Heteronotia binoei]
MAAEGPLKELCEEASCSICLDFFRDPVMIAECGHNFCRACLNRSWGEAGAAEPSCPQCRGKAQPSSLRPNQQLASFVEIAKRFSPSAGKGAEAKGGEGEGGVCEKHREPLKFFCREDEAPLCVVCSRSQEHRGHQVTPLEKEAAGEKEQRVVAARTARVCQKHQKLLKLFCKDHEAPICVVCEQFQEHQYHDIVPAEEAAQEYKRVVAARTERVCQKHQEPLKLFCKDHEAPICVVCEQSQEHQYHDIIPVEEAAQEYKDQFCNCVEILLKERNKILAYKADIVKESQDLLRQTKGERQKVLIKFRQLQKFLEEQEKLLLAQMEEVEKEVARKRDQHLARLSEELSSLESLIREMETCQQPASSLLQGARRTLQKYEEKEPFESPVAFPLALKWRIWDFSDLNPLLEAIKKQFEANVTLDPDTAHLKLILSEGQKSVRRGEKAQALPTNPVRFENYGAVMGREGFTGGCHFWEVLVGSEEEWSLGVARKSVKRKGDITFSPEEGFWEVGKWGGSYQVSGKVSDLTLSGELKRIRVCLNYAGGRVAFFDADRAALLYEFSGASFHGETLLPHFWVYGKGHLRISS